MTDRTMMMMMMMMKKSVKNISDLRRSTLGQGRAPWGCLARSVNCTDSKIGPDESGNSGEMCPSTVPQSQSYLFTPTSHHQRHGLIFFLSIASITWKKTNSRLLAVSCVYYDYKKTAVRMNPHLIVLLSLLGKSLFVG